MFADTFCSTSEWALLPNYTESEGWKIRNNGLNEKGGKQGFDGRRQKDHRKYKTLLGRELQRI